MHTCPKCYKLTKSKPDFCTRCGFDYSPNGFKTNFNHNKSENSNETNSTEQSEIERLSKIIEQLIRKEKQALASRDEWQKRAEIAEKTKRSTLQENDKKFRKVKKMFSKMYHPDSLVGDKFERIIKQEIFKEFWQVIQDIENIKSEVPSD